MTPEVGTLSHGMDGALQISVETECYRIDAGDAMVRRTGAGAPEVRLLRPLLFYGRVIPISEDRSRTAAGGILVSEVAIEGHAAMNAAGKAVMLHTRVGSYIIPLISFQRVARGEAASAPLFPLIPEVEL